MSLKKENSKDIIYTQLYGFKNFYLILIIICPVGGAIEYTNCREVRLQNLMVSFQ